MRRFGRRFGVMLAAAVCAATDFGALQPQGYLSDFAQVVPAPQRRALEDYCKRVEDSSGAQIALVTLATLGGEPIENVANLLFRKWGIGAKKSDEGVLVLLVIRDRRSRVEVGYGLEPLIPDGFAGSVLREMRPALRANDFGSALTLAAESIGTRIAQKKNVRIEAEPLRRVRRPASGSEVPWFPLLGLGAVILLAIFKVGRGARNPRLRQGAGDLLTGLILGNLLGRGGGWGGYRRSGGGFGGYDSGGGFGGFGGGDSGGGGASSDW